MTEPRRRPHAALPRPHRALRRDRRAQAGDPEPARRQPCRAWAGAGWATRPSSTTPYKVIAALLVLIGAALLIGHDTEGTGPALTGPAQVVAGVAAGFGIGVVASLMRVAGGELLIPTLILLFGADVKLAGTLSPAVIRPTM